MSHHLGMWEDVGMWCNASCLTENVLFGKAIEWGPNVQAFPGLILFLNKNPPWLKFVTRWLPSPHLYDKWFIFFYCDWSLCQHSGKGGSYRGCLIGFHCWGPFLKQVIGWQTQEKGSISILCLIDKPIFSVNISSVPAICIRTCHMGTGRKLGFVWVEATDKWNETNIRTNLQ